MEITGQCFYGTGRQGHPIYVHRVKELSPEYALEFEVEQIELFYYVLHEKMLKVLFVSCSKAKNQRVDQIIAIFDLADVKLLTFFTKVIYGSFIFWCCLLGN